MNLILLICSLLVLAQGEDEVVCPEHEASEAVFVPHPRDCGLYYACVGTNPVLMECPAGLFWDASNSYCNYPELSGCSMEFVKVFSHDTAGGLFSSQADAMNKNADNPEAELYSVLDTLEHYRAVRGSTSGSLHLKLCYPEVREGERAQCNEWLQTSNPATEATITGFQAVNLAFPENSWGQAWGGLGRAEKWNRFRTLMDDSPSTGRWWSAVGATSYSVLQWSTIPGPRNIRVTKVELYAFGKA